MEDFKRNIKEIREFLGLSQSDIARKTGLQPSAIAHFESGRRKPNMQNLMKLSVALGVTVDRLLFGISNKKGE